MYRDIYGVLSFIFNKTIIYINNIILKRNRCIYIIIGQKNIRSLSAYIRYGSTLFGSYFIDITAFERHKVFYNKINIYIINHIFYISR